MENIISKINIDKILDCCRQLQIDKTQKNNKIIKYCIGNSSFKSYQYNNAVYINSDIIDQYDILKEQFEIFNKLCNDNQISYRRLVFIDSYVKIESVAKNKDFYKAYICNCILFEKELFIEKNKIICLDINKKIFILPTCIPCLGNIPTYSLPNVLIVDNLIGDDNLINFITMDSLI